MIEYCARMFTGLLAEILNLPQLITVSAGGGVLAVALAAVIVQRVDR